VEIQIRYFMNTNRKLIAKQIRSVTKNSKKNLYITDLLFAYVAPKTLAGPRYIY